MNTSLLNPIRVITAAVLIYCVPARPAFGAETASPIASSNHVVPLSELQERSVAASEGRERDLQELDRLLSSEPVAKALQATKLDGEHVRRAVALLDNDELARLAERSRQVQSDFAAGSLTNEQLTYIVIALATAVVILVIVH